MALSLGWHARRDHVRRPTSRVRSSTAGRSPTDAVKESAYGLTFHRAIGFAPHGTYWRALRRIASSHLFSPKQITTSGPHRAQIAAQMVRSLAVNETSVRVREVIKRGSLHNVMWSVFGKRSLAAKLGSGRSSDSRLIITLTAILFCCFSAHRSLLLGRPLAPSLGKIYYRGTGPNRTKARIPGPQWASDTLGSMGLMSGLAHPETSRGGRHSFNATRLMALSLGRCTRVVITLRRPTSREMIFRGTDTVAVLIEWTLARLVLHQDVQVKVHEELDRVVGGARAVTESDSASLLYLQAVLKEALRLHPPGPLLSWARLATEDVLVDGKLVPAGTTAMVNMWAITHDPHVWEAPLEFRPERFLGLDGSEFSVFGSDLRLAPFGSGRRSCPGKTLAMATVTFWMAALLHEYR
ncbi:uncharacterized protein A4U43_C08F320 [Asparagus officinalis]|nr:uncharacterized protein A4U43_C08F320 [Asparagus officinalis]